MAVEREKIDFDVLFVGGGPANLAGAVRLMQLARDKGISLEVALIDKGAEIGSHAISGAILNPIALAELMPDYREQGFPLEATVRGDEFYYLTERSAMRMPLVPRYLHNTGFFVISLARFTRWLAEFAENLGVNIFPGFTGTELLLADDQRTIVGVRTGDKGIGPDGQPKGNFEAGIDLMAKVTILGEGARGSLTRQLEQKMKLQSGRLPQVYETGIKEVIQLRDNHWFSNRKANVLHLMGYPLGINRCGGGFIYEMQDNRVAIGFLVGLGYSECDLDPYDMFITFKRQPFVADIIQGGRVLEQGARTVSTGGYYTIPEVAVPGGLLVGGCAGFQNTPALKGIHVAMKSGMLAAEAVIEALAARDFSPARLDYYRSGNSANWLDRELHEGRNFAQANNQTGLLKLIHLGAQYVTRGRGLQDRMPLEPDWQTLKPDTRGQGRLPRPPAAGEYDGVLVVDKLTGVYLSKTMHREDQPSHLIVHDRKLCIETCYPTYGSPCTRFCPAGVYEIETDQSTGSRKLKLNPANCLHCKTCDIKDPYQNITWTCPEGGEGPGYATV
jgi:electron-transferring-flavoprotein dehydrogenase